MLNENGFQRKTYEELLADMEAKARELFGEDVHLSSHSVLGIFIRVFAYFFSLFHELLERVYNSGFIGTATGVQLDRLGSNNGVLRDPAMPAVVTLAFTGKAGYVIQEGVQFKTENDIVFEMVDVVTLDSTGIGQGTAISQIYSETANVAVGAITIIAEPVEDLYSVTNIDRASGGAEKERDEVYRERIKITTQANAGPPVNGLITSINQVTGVRSVSVVENNTMENDRYGNPPKSVHIYVFGGDKESVGEAIFDAVAAGIQTVGSISTKVIDLSGFEHTVYFDLAEPLDIYASVSVQVNSKFEDTGILDIKNVVLNYINSLNMGETVVHSLIYADLYRIAGITSSIVKIGKTSTDLNAADVTVGPSQAAQIKEANIEVIVNER